MSTQIKVSHTFDALRQLIFNALTDAKHLINWWGPEGWTVEVAESDIRPGGVFHTARNLVTVTKCGLNLNTAKLLNQKKLCTLVSFLMKKVTQFVHTLTQIGQWKF